MKRFNIPSDPYDENRKMFNKNILQLEDNSISCLVGCNGTGKTTVLFFIEQQLKKRNAYEIRGKYCDFREVFNKEKYNDEMYLSFNVKTEIMNSEEDTFLKRLTCNNISTGESILYRFGDGLELLGDAIRNPKNKGKTLYVFMDDCDAGTSIDMINDIKSIFDLIIKDCKQNEITYYIILTANSYELCKDVDCISVHNFEHKKFNSYEEFKSFVLESREIKKQEFKE